MTTDLFSLDNKIALVTGASRGIGQAAARLLAQQGAHVIISSRKQAGCEQVAEAIRAAGGQASAFACHIGELAQIEAIYDHIRSVHGRLDILINNAATNPYYGDIVDTELAAFSKTVDVNIRGYFYMSTHACRLMRTHGGGAIVNIASVNGVRPGAGQGVYSITKGAIINMTKAFALECGADNIRVNALLPGLTDTQFASALTSNEDVLNSWLKRIPLQRYGQPDDMAAAVLYLASAASRFATGSCMTVDGGYLI